MIINERPEIQGYSYGRVPEAPASHPGSATAPDFRWRKNIFNRHLLSIVTEKLSLINICCEEACTTLERLLDGPEGAAAL
jgi:hypothetical protein